MTIYDLNFLETFRFPKKFNLIMRALYAGWAPDTRFSDLFQRRLVLKRHDPNTDHTVYLFLEPSNTFDIKQKKGAKTIGTLAHVHFRTLRFDTHNPFRIVGITYKDTPLSWDFDLLKPFDGLIPSVLDENTTAWLKKFHRALMRFWEIHFRPPGTNEFIAFIREYLDYHNLKEIYRLLRLGLGKFWTVHFENHKTNPKARRCYYYPVSSTASGLGDQK